jgi:hypothetical protein
MYRILQGLALALFSAACFATVEVSPTCPNDGGGSGTTNEANYACVTEAPSCQPPTSDADYSTANFPNACDPQIGTRIPDNACSILCQDAVACGDLVVDECSGNAWILD